MILIDANLPIYAYDASDERHERAKRWFTSTLNGDEVIGFALVTLLAFVRIATNPGIHQHPLPTVDALAAVGSWLARSNVAMVTPTDRHWAVLAETAREGQARGPLLMDAHLAALAIEHGAVLATTDRDFARFKRLRTIDPLAG